MSKVNEALAVSCKVELSDLHDNDDAGCTLTLRVADADSLGMLKERFAETSAGARQHFLLYLLKMEEPGVNIDPVRRRHLEKTLQLEPLSRNALTLARDPDFWCYLENIGLAAVSGEVEEAHAKQYIYRTCAVASPHELDRDSAAARLYRSQIIRPFLAWIQAH
jgi:hypothetical protein